MAAARAYSAAQISVSGELCAGQRVTATHPKHAGVDHSGHRLRPTGSAMNQPVKSKARSWEQGSGTVLSLAFNRFSVAAFWGDRPGGGGL